MKYSYFKFIFFIRRFTEELFATLIAFIFIFNAFKNLAHIGTNNKFSPTTLAVVGCECIPNNTEAEDGQIDFDWKNVTRDQCASLNGTLVCKYIEVIILVYYIYYFSYHD